MGNLFAELKRRHIYRIAAAYAVVAWIILQIVNNVAPAFNLPGSAVMLVIVLLAAGFPIALIFAWVLELKSPNAPTKTGAMDWILVAVAMTFVGMFAYQQFAPSRATVTAQSGIEAAREAAAKPAGISIAVLPFTNLSGDANQEFFSDGMTEEITAALVKIADLRVVARTSAFEFKGQNRNIQTIGEQLHATHLIEGSVRKAGERVRVTVQLIKAEDGTHIWSENYDRDLTDIFAIQEDIARAITSSLNMQLGLKPGENLVNNRSIDPQSHEKLLRGKALVDGRGGLPDSARAAALLDEVVSKNPDYAPGWAYLSGAYFLMAAAHSTNFSESIADTRAQTGALREKGEAAARRAIQLDPNYAFPYDMLAVFVWSRAKPLEADDLFTKALSLDATDAYVLDGYSIRIGTAGRLKEALASEEKARAVEPFLPPVLQRTTEFLWLNGDNDAAIALAKTLRAGDRAPRLSMIYASMGRYGDAADALMEIVSNPNSIEAQVVRLLRALPSKTSSPANLPSLPRALEPIYHHLATRAPRPPNGCFPRRQTFIFWV